MVNNIYRGLGRSVGQIFGPEGIKTAQLVAEMTARKHAQQAAAPAPSSSHGETPGGGAARGLGGAGPEGVIPEPAAIPLLRSKESFKVLTECPLIVMLLFQLYPKYIKANIPDLIPLMIDALRLAPQLQRNAEGVVPVCLRGRYKEMIACQVRRPVSMLGGGPQEPTAPWTRATRSQASVVGVGGWLCLLESSRSLVGVTGCSSEHREEPSRVGG